MPHAIRDADNELYDAACELLLAAQRLAGAARRPGAAPAVPAALGCLAVALDTTAEASRSLGEDRAGAAAEELMHALRRAAAASDRVRAEVGAATTRR